MCIYTYVSASSEYFRKNYIKDRKAPQVNFLQ